MSRRGAVPREFSGRVILVMELDRLPLQVPRFGKSGALGTSEITNLRHRPPLSALDRFSIESPSLVIETNRSLPLQTPTFPVGVCLVLTRLGTAGV